MSRKKEYQDLSCKQLLNMANRSDPVVAELCARLEDMRNICVTVQTRAQDLLDDVAEVIHESK